MKQALLIVSLSLAVFLATGYALAGPGSGGTGPSGGCAIATATSPGCVTLNQVQNPANLSTNVIDAGYLLLSGTQPQTVCTTATAICAIKSSINAATAGAGTPAFSFESANALDADDVLFMIYQQSGGSSVFQVDNEGDTVLGGALQYGNTNGNLTSASAATMLLTSSATDATTSGTVGAITLKAGANITATDLLLDVQDSAGAHALTVTEDGTARSLLGFTTPATGTGASAPLQIGTGGSLNLNGNSGTGAQIRSTTNTAIDYCLNGSCGYSFSTTSLVIPAALDLPTTGAGSCTLDGASPSKCTATVTAAAICTCSKVGTTAAIAATGCAVSLASTTLTITSANGETGTVNYHCIL